MKAKPKPMTVKQVITYLSKCPPNAIVYRTFANVPRGRGVLKLVAPAPFITVEEIPLEGGGIFK